VRAEFERLIRREARLATHLAHLRDKPAETPDGVRIPLYINSGLIADVIPSRDCGAEGIGLYRTEFPFLAAERFPGEEQQLQIYRTVLRSFAPLPVTLRTLDVGGDKNLPYFPIEEDNPFLGWRGIRITLDHPEIFMVQLRAMLRANHQLGNLRLLLPMVSNVSEVDEALELIERAREELSEELETPLERPPVGVMVSHPVPAGGGSQQRPGRRPVRLPAPRRPAGPAAGGGRGTPLRQGGERLWRDGGGSRRRRPAAGYGHGFTEHDRLRPAAHQVGDPQLQPPASR